MIVAATIWGLAFSPSRIWPAASVSSSATDATLLLATTSVSAVRSFTKLLRKLTHSNRNSAVQATRRHAMHVTRTTSVTLRWIGRLRGSRMAPNTRSTDYGRAESQRPCQLRGAAPDARHQKSEEFCKNVQNVV